jgi:hypothetical protein
MPDEIITCLRIEVAELRKDVIHLTDSVEAMREELSQIRSESDQRKTLDKLIIVALTGGVSATVSWVMSLRGV